MAKIWFPLGIGSFALLIGFMTGAADSALIGTVVTGTTGVLTILFNLFKIEKTDNGSKVTMESISEADDNSNAVQIGKMLFFFSLPFITGLFWGTKYRNDEAIVRKNTIIWQDSSKDSTSKSNAPKNIIGALDWIILTEQLQKKGYSLSQIQEIYKVYEKDTTFKNDSTLKLSTILRNTRTLEHNQRIIKTQ